MSTALVCGVGPAQAADLAISVVDARGKPVEHAAVLVRLAAPSVAPASAAPTTQIVQHFQSFAPNVLPVAVGTTVQFPNLDRMRHHVYSFSPGNTFEIHLYSGEEIPQVRFDKPGVVALGCNIHDWMQGYIYVTDAPYFGATDTSGAVTLAGLPPGDYRVSVWHPQLQTEIEVQRTTLGTAAVPVAVRLDSNVEPLMQERPDDDPLLVRLHASHQ